MSSVSASEENKQDHDSENNCCSPTGPLQPPLKRTDQADMGLDIPVEPKASSYHKVPHEGHGTISSNGRPSLPLWLRPPPQIFSSREAVSDWVKMIVTETSSITIFKRLTSQKLGIFFPMTNYIGLSSGKRPLIRIQVSFKSSCALSVKLVYTTWPKSMEIRSTVTIYSMILPTPGSGQWPKRVVGMGEKHLLTN